MPTSYVRSSCEHNRACTSFATVCLVDRSFLCSCWTSRRSQCGKCGTRNCGQCCSSGCTWWWCGLNARIGAGARSLYPSILQLYLLRLAASVCVSASAVRTRGFCAAGPFRPAEGTLRSLAALLQMYSGTAKDFLHEWHLPSSSKVRCTPFAGCQFGPGPGVPSTHPSTECTPQRTLSFRMPSAGSAMTRPPAMRVIASSTVLSALSSCSGKHALM